MGIRNFFMLLKDSFRLWQRVKSSMMAAALAYHGLLSIAPLLIVVLVLTGVFLGRDVAQEQFVSYLNTFVGTDTASFVKDVVLTIVDSNVNIATSIFGIGVFLFGSVEVFYKLQIALNTIWDVDDVPGRMKRVVKNRIISFLLVILSGFLLFVFFFIGTVLSFVRHWLSVVLYLEFVGIGFWQNIEMIFSFGVVALLFASVYKVLPNTKIQWKDVRMGGIIAALLYTIGKVLIGWYLVTLGLSSLYGAVGSFVIFLIWIYYSTQIFLFGAAYTRIYAERYGSKKKF